jgi:hypothetical protein
VLKFDLSDIPHGSTINHASLLMNIAQDRTTRSNEQFGLEVYRLESEYTNYTSVDFSELLLMSPEPVVPADSSLLVIPLRDLTSSWVNGFSDNHGILIRTSQPGLDVSRIALYSTETDTSLAPYIEMDWTVPPTF